MIEISPNTVKFEKHEPIFPHETWNMVGTLKVHKAIPYQHEKGVEDIAKKEIAAQLNNLFYGDLRDELDQLCRFCARSATDIERATAILTRFEELKDMTRKGN